MAEKLKINGRKKIAIFNKGENEMETKYTLFYKFIIPVLDWNIAGKKQTADGIYTTKERIGISIRVNEIG